MTTYSNTTFGSTDATYPTNFTKRFVTTNETVVAANVDTGEPEDDYTFEQEWSVLGWRLNSWDTVEDGNELNIDVVVRLRINETAIGINPFQIWLRASGAAGSETGYCFLLRDISFADGMGIDLWKYSAGAGTIIKRQVIGADGVLDDVQSGEWIYMRCRVNGTAPGALQCRLWRDGEIEPTIWHVDETDSTHTSAGWNGIGGYDANQNTEVDYIGGGTNGDTAPLNIDAANIIRTTAAYVQAVTQVVDPITRVTAVYAQAVTQVVDPSMRLTAAYVQAIYTESGATTPVDSDHVIPVEWQQGLAIDKQTPVEYASEDLQVDHGIPINWSVPLAIDHQIPAEWINVTTPGDHQVPVEWGLVANADNEIPVSWLQGIAADGTVPINWEGEFSADSSIPVEWSLGINIDRQIPVEWTLTTTPGDHQVPAEWGGSFASDHQIIFAWKGEPQPPPDSVIPFAWRGPFADPGSDYDILFDWKLDLQIDREIPAEWNAGLESDHQIPVDWLLETFIVHTSVIPINWAGFIDSDHVAPLEWTAELDGDRVIPVEWALTVFLEIDRQMPVEWKQELAVDGNVPVEWHEELLLDNSIPYEWNTPFSPVDFGIPIEWTLELGVNASIPVEWVLDVLPEFSIPVEWMVDVGASNSIPVEWRSPTLSFDHEMPIDWFSPVVFDQVMPIAWLQENFLFSDNEIPIEWQQIFFKQFDNAIPWEVRGISDTSHGLPVGWRSDPGHTSRIPVEWTDPLFALFVSDPKFCETWIADCNGVNWEAQLFASSWLADELPFEAQSAQESGGTWVARDEQIGGTWLAATRKSNWEAQCLPTSWIAPPPDIWYAEECGALWAAQEQQVRWAAASQGARWTVLEPNVRGDQ